MQFPTLIWSLTRIGSLCLTLSDLCLLLSVYVLSYLYVSSLVYQMSFHVCLCLLFLSVYVFSGLYVFSCLSLAYFVCLCLLLSIKCLLLSVYVFSFCLSNVFPYLSMSSLLICLCLLLSIKCLLLSVCLPFLSIYVFSGCLLLSFSIFSCQYLLWSEERANSRGSSLFSNEVYDALRSLSSNTCTSFLYISTILRVATHKTMKETVTNYITTIS